MISRIDDPETAARNCAFIAGIRSRKVGWARGGGARAAVLTEEDARSEVTRLLKEVRGSDEAKRDLLPLVYEELRALARRRMADERPDHTLQATALVHEAYLKLVGDRNLAWEKRSHFFIAASEAMRRILVDHARKRLSLKRGEGKPRASLTGLDLAENAEPDALLAVDEALERLQAEDPRAANVVRLRFYGGLDFQETAAAMGVSERTVHREWAFARARLFQILAPEEG